MRPTFVGKSHYHVMLLCLALAWLALPCSSLPRACFGQSPTLQQLYAHDAVSIIRFQVAEDKWDRLRHQNRDFVGAILGSEDEPFKYVRAKLSINGTDLGEVAIRKKGFFGSLDDDFPSLRIKLDKYQKSSPISDTEALVLNNNKQDNTLLSQYLAYRFFNSIGLPAPRVGFASVYVNDNHLGLYSLVEPVDEYFLRTHFTDSNGDLWEGTISDFDQPSVDRIEWKSGANVDQGRDRLRALAKLLENSEPDLHELKEHVDLDSFYKFWAAESLLAFWDGYAGNQNNYFLYRAEESKTFRFIPWGADSLWTSMNGPFRRSTPQSNSVYLNAVLPFRIYATAEGKERYRREMQQLLDQHWNEDELKSEIQRLGELLQPHLHSRQRNASAAQRAMQRFIERRREQVVKELDAWPVASGPKPQTTMHRQELGSLNGEFKTAWQEVPKLHDAPFNLRIGEHDVLLSDVTICAKPSMPFRFGPPTGAQNTSPSIEIVGKTSEGKGITVSIVFPQEGFKKSDDVKFSGSVVVSTNAGLGFFGPRPETYLLSGNCKLSSASMVSKEAIEGKFDGKLFQLRGGFFEP